MRDVLHQVISETHDYNLPILVFANKQDVEGALELQVVKDHLSIDAMVEQNKRKVFV